MSDVKRLREIDSQLAEAERIFGNATAIYNEAAATFSAIVKPLSEERENLICNLDAGGDNGGQK
jgi:hypothetical protein